ncbi:MAG: class I SAM-dependent methyltransferase [Burkholderiaceae bacterium]
MRFINERIRSGDTLPQRSLVLGAGDGTETAYLISQGQDVIAVDMDSASAEFVQRAITERRDNPKYDPQRFGAVTNIQTSFQTVEVPEVGSIDLIWSASLPFVPRNELPAVLDRIETALAPDGYIVATFFGPNHPLAGQSGKAIYSESELVGLFGQNYDVVSVTRISPDGRLADGTHVKLDLFAVVARRRSSDAPSSPSSP